MPRIDYKAICCAASMEDVLAALGIEVSHGKALCPFHDDRNASMQVYRDGYHCFACGAHGDAIDLVQQVRKCSRREAAREVAYIGGVGIISAGLEAQHREAERQIREKQLSDDVDRIQALETAIAETRKVCYNAEAYSDEWCIAQRRLDMLLWEHEAVDGRIVHEMQRRYNEKHGEHTCRKAGRNGSVL